MNIYKWPFITPIINYLKSEFKTTVNLLIQHVLCSLVTLKQAMNYLCLQAAVQEFTIALWAQQSFAKPGMASQNRRKKLRRFIQLSNQSTYIFASFCKAMLATQSLLNPKKQIVDRWITGWSPSDLTRVCLLSSVRLVYDNTNFVHLLL